MIIKIFTADGQVIEKLRQLEIGLAINGVPEEKIEEELNKYQVQAIEIDPEKGLIRFVNAESKKAIDSFMTVHYAFTPPNEVKEPISKSNEKWYHKFLRRNKSLKGSSFI